MGAGCGFVVAIGLQYPQRPRVQRRVLSSRPVPKLAVVAVAGLVASAPLPAQFTWNSGDILTVLNPATIGVGETLGITTTGPHDFNAKVVTNNGTVNWLAGARRSGGGGRFANNTLATDSASSVMNNGYTGGWAFNNATTGTYLKTTGAVGVTAYRRRRL